VMANYLSGIIDQTSPVPGEQAPCRHGVEVTPRINPIPASHASSTCSRTTPPVSSPITNARRRAQRGTLPDPPRDHGVGINHSRLQEYC
jgi:hypothetical protein